MFKPQIITLFLFHLLLCSTALLGQQGDFCLTFDDLKPGLTLGNTTGLQAGDTLLNENDITVRLLPFYYADGTSDFRNITVVRDSLASNGRISPALFPSNINLELDFRGLPDRTQQVCLPFRYLGGAINLAVNEGEIITISSLRELLKLKEKDLGVDLDVRLDNSPNTIVATGVLCFSGAIKTLTIGGQELTIDNICATVADVQAACKIQQLVAEPHPCTPNGIFYLDVAFKVRGKSSGSYNVIVNNQPFGPFVYDPDTFLTVGPIKTYGDEEFLVQVYDADRNDCSAKTSFRWRCGIECPAADPEVYVQYCEETKRPELYVNFELLRDVPSKFQIQLNDRFFGFFDTKALPLRIGLPSSTLPDLPLKYQICFDNPNGTPSCCLEGIAKVRKCEDQDCFTFNEIRGDSMFGKGINEPGDVIFSKHDVPVSIHEIVYPDGNTGFENLLITSDLFGGNFESATGRYIFQGNTSIQFNFQERKDIRVKEICFDFIDGGGVENISINGSEVKVVQSLAELSGKDIFPDAKIYVALTDPSTGSNYVPEGMVCIEGDIRQLRIGGQEFGIDNLCFQAEKVKTDDCIISNLTISETQCNDKGEFYAQLQFRVNEPGERGYSVVGTDGEDYGTFSYEVPFPLIGPFPGDGNKRLRGLIVYDNQFPACADTVFLPSVVCPPSCMLRGIKVEAVTCLDNGNFDLKLWVEGTATNVAQRVNISVEGQVIGTFPINQLIELKDVAVYTDALEFEVQACLPLTTNQRECCVSAVINKERCRPLPGDCILFDALPDSVYGKERDQKPGTIAFKEQGVGFRLEELESYDWSNSYGNLRVVPAERLDKFETASGHSLYYDGIATVINFGDYPSAIESVQMDYYFDGTAINLAANGSQIQILSNLTPGTFNLGNGVELTVSTSSVDGKLGTLEFKGRIKALFVGGNGLALDNLCINPAEICKIGDLKLDPLPCDDRRQFYIMLDFEYEGTSKYFTVAQNGQSIKRYAYEDLPVRMGPFQAPWEPGNRFTVVDSQNPDCSSSAEFGPYFCAPECTISQVDVLEVFCRDDGTYDLLLKVEGNPFSRTLVLRTESGFETRFQYSNEPIRISGIPLNAAGGIKDWLIVCDANNTDCCFDLDYELPCPRPCSIENAEVFDFECSPEKGVYHLSLALKGRNLEGGVYVVSTRSGYEKRFEYNGQAVRLSGIPLTDLDEDAMKICRLPVPGTPGSDCCFDLSYRLPCRPPACEIKELSVGEIECDSSSNTYHLTVKIDGLKQGEPIILSTPSGYLRRMAYPGTPIRLTNIPLPASGSLQDVLTVCAGLQPNDAYDCCQRIAVDLDCSRICSIEAFEIERLLCVGNEGFYHATVIVKGANLGDDLLFTFADGDSTFAERRKYNGVPIQLTKIPYRGRPWETLKVQAQPLSSGGYNCFALAEFRPPCAPQECTIKELEVFDFDCTPHGTYSMTLKVKGEGLSEYLYLKTFSGYTATVHLVDNMVRLDEIPLPANGLEDGIVICDSLKVDCCFEQRFKIDCESICNIRDVKARDISCNDNNTYNLILAIDAVGTGKYFYLRTGSGHETKVEVENGIAKVTGLPLPRDSIDKLILTAIDRDACSFELSYAVHCRPKPCIFERIEIQKISCNSDTSYNLQLMIKGSGAIYDNFVWFRTKSGYEARFMLKAGQPIMIQGIPNLGTGEDAFSICEPNFPNCCYEMAYRVPCVLEDECFIGSLQAVPQPCRDNGSFYFDLNFRHKNTAKQFLVYINGSFFKRYKYEDLPVAVGPVIPGIVYTPEYEIKVVDAENEECSSSTTIEGCKESCNFSDVNVRPVDCEDGMFYAEIETTVYQPKSDGFFVIAEGELFGPFRYGQQIPRLGPFPADGTTSYDFLLIDSDDPSCFGYVELPPVDCEEECQINDLRAEIVDCNPDGSYKVAINFKHRNAGNEYFDIFTANGSIIATYRLDELPIVTDLVLPAEDSIHYLGVCINDQIGCCASTYLPARCKQECDGIPFKAVPTACDADGRFHIDLTFDIDLTVIYPVIIEINGRFYDSLQIGNPQVRIGPFPAGKPYEIRVIDGWHPECVSSLTVDATDCQPDCGFDDVQIEALSCNPDGSYKVWLDFFYEGDSSQMFSLYNYERDRIARFKLTDLPLELEFVGIPDSLPVLWICADSTDCCNRAYIRFPDCPDCTFNRARAKVLNCINEREYEVGITANWDLSRIGDYIIEVGNQRFDSLYLDAEGQVVIGPLKADRKTVHKIEIIDTRVPGCVVTTMVGPFTCKSEEVWPGDINLDNIASHFDLLNLGIAFGARGSGRPDGSTAWQGIPATTWGRRFADGTDYKHADCNGDGVVNEEDIAIIRKNYGRTHGSPEAARELPFTAIDPPLFFDIEEDEHLPDSGYFTIPIVLGTPEDPITNIYGLAFTVEFDPKVINPDKVEIIYPTSWLGESGVNMTTIDRVYKEEGKIEIALTRIDQNEVSGYGPVAMLRGIKDDIVGRQEHSEVEIRESRGIRTDQQIVVFSTGKQGISFKSDIRYGLIDLQQGLRMFPNPATDRVTVSSIYNVPIDAMQIITTDGKLMSPVIKEANQLNVSNLPKGLYIIRIETGGFTLHKKLFVK